MNNKQYPDTEKTQDSMQAFRLKEFSEFDVDEKLAYLHESVCKLHQANEHLCRMIERFMRHGHDTQGQMVVSAEWPIELSRYR